MRRKSSDGVFLKRGEGRELIYYWKIDKDKSKNFKCQVECAMDYITRYIERNPKYEELVMDKTWDEIFPLFGIKIPTK